MNPLLSWADGAKDEINRRRLKARIECIFILNWLRDRHLLFPGLRYNQEFTDQCLADRQTKLRKQQRRRGTGHHSL